MVKIRGIVELDIIRCLTLAKEYAEEATQWSPLSFDPVTLCSNMAIAIADPDQQIFMAYEGTEIVGFMWGIVSAPTWSSDKIAHDVVLYVHKDHRDLVTAKGLVEAFEDWAEANGASVILTGASSGIHKNKAAKALYGHLGYSDGGQNFYKVRR